MSDAPVTAPTQVSEGQVEDFLGTALQIPESDVRNPGLPPDAVSGPAVVRRQQISVPLSMGSSAKYDIYVITWPMEISSATPRQLGNAQCTGDFVFREEVNRLTGVSNPGLVVRGAAQAVLTAGGYATQIAVGGTKVYVMTPGQCPLPTSATGFFGPATPLQVLDISFDDSMLSDDGLHRVLGDRLKISYTGPEVTASGTIYQSSHASHLGVEEHTVLGDINPVVWGTNDASATLSGAFDSMVFDLPASDPISALRLPGATTRPAFDGALQDSEIDWSDNRPNPRTGQNMHFRSSKKMTVVANVNGWNNDSAFVDVLCWNTAVEFYSGSPPVASGIGWGTSGMVPVVQANRGFHQVMLLGVPGGTTGAAFNISRTLTLQTFIPPTSDLSPFAARSPPCDMAAMERVINTLQATPQFWAASDNAGGAFARSAFKVFKKTAKVVKQVAPNSSIGKVADASLRVVGAVSRESAPQRPRTLPPSRATNSNSSEPQGRVDRLSRRLEAVGIGSSSGSMPRSQRVQSLARAARSRFSAE